MDQEKQVDPEVNRNCGFVLRKTLPFGLDMQKAIRLFFAGNSAVTIAVLLLIMVFLLKEGMGFLPAYQRELGEYRRSGLELADKLYTRTIESEKVVSALNQAMAAEIRTEIGEWQDKRTALIVLQGKIEDLAEGQRKDIEAALERQAPEEELEPLRLALRAAKEKAVGTLRREEVTNDEKNIVFTQEEWERLLGDLRLLSPELPEEPPFLAEMKAKVTAMEQEVKKGLGELQTVIRGMEDALEPIQTIADDMSSVGIEIRNEGIELAMAEDSRTMLLAAAKVARTEEEKTRFMDDYHATAIKPIDYATRRQPIMENALLAETAVPEYIQKVSQLVIPEGHSPKGKKLLKIAKVKWEKHLTGIEEALQEMKSWNPDKPVSMMEAMIGFLFGREWVTNTSRMEFYGALPLLSGTAIIALIALLIATPFSVAAAIYTNQVASLAEKEMIKPVIEMIQAIPSVVFGFIGIAIFGAWLKDFSQVEWLSWVPGFPISERLNMFNAGCLLALMAMPTMYSLAEDALQNVPRHYAEASEALGATRLQTIFKVIIPASISGIFAAMLLGLGRIIGETMVVLLIAGNRIAIPDFNDGVGAVFQPAHTMTGIIAQELGEVNAGSTHWKALFMIGILLFFISLVINFSARWFVSRMKLKAN